MTPNEEETWTITEKGHQWLGGYRKGHSDGYEEGHRDGWTDGYVAGEEDARSFTPTRDEQHTEPQPGEASGEVPPAGADYVRYPSTGFPPGEGRPAGYFTAGGITLLEDDEVSGEGYAHAYDRDSNTAYVLTWDDPGWSPSGLDDEVYDGHGFPVQPRHGDLHGPLPEPLPEGVTVWCSCENRTVPAEDAGACCDEPTGIASDLVIGRDE
jgi:hypothetical protein